MLHMDVSALMGYTGATYKEFFGSGSGMFYTITIMLLWVVTPLLFAIRSFNRKDL
jgi:Cu-processing system permease protein